MRSLATWCVRHRRIVVTGWLVVLIALTAISQSVGTRKANSVNLAVRRALRRSGFSSGSRRRHRATASRSSSRSRTASTDHPVRAQVNTMLAKVAALGDVASVASPYSPAGSAQISRSGQVEFANVTLNKQAASVTTAQAKQFVAAAQTGATNGVQVGSRVRSPAPRTRSARARPRSAAPRRSSSWSSCSARCSLRCCRC